MNKLLRKLADTAKSLGLWAVATDLMAGTSLILAMTMPGHLVTLATLTLAWGIIVYRTRKGIFRTAVGVGALGHYLVARYLILAAGTATIFAADEMRAGAIAAVGLLAVLFSGERVVRGMNGYATPYAANLPGVDGRNFPRFRYGIIFALNVLGLAVFVVDGFVEINLLVVTFMTLSATLIVTAAALADIIQRVGARQRFDATIGRELTDYGPQFYLYWFATPGSTYQVEMWLPYLERIGVPYAIIVRTITNFRELSELTDRPVLYRKAIADLDEVIVPSLKGAVYVNNSTRNNHFVRYGELVHIQLNHGDSDKAPSSNPVFRIYDLNFVAGQAAIDRFAANGVGTHDGFFRVVGRPQVEDVSAASRTIAEISNPTVLYAPTWAGFHDDSNYSSLLAGEAIVSKLIERGCAVVFRPHPYSNRHPKFAGALTRIEEMLAADRETTGRPHVFGREAMTDMSIFECFNASDAMVSDVSSVVGDYLHSGKPYAMVSTRATGSAFELQFPMARAAYVLEARRDALVDADAVLDALLVSDPKQTLRAELATYYLGDIPRDGYASRFVEIARAELGIDELTTVSP